MQGVRRMKISPNETQGVGYGVREGKNGEGYADRFKRYFDCTYMTVYNHPAKPFAR